MNTTPDKKLTPIDEATVAIDYNFREYQILATSTKEIPKDKFPEIQKAIESILNESQPIMKGNITDGTIIQFLEGSHSYDGIWFGELHPIIKGPFWWRKILREYASQQAPASMTHTEIEQWYHSWMAAHDKAEIATVNVFDMLKDFAAQQAPEGMYTREQVEKAIEFGFNQCANNGYISIYEQKQFIQSLK